MDSAEIKVDLFRKLEALNSTSLEEAYGILLNFINTKTSTDDWTKLTTKQQDAIKIGLQQLDNNEGVKHQDVMDRAKNKYLNV